MDIHSVISPIRLYLLDMDGTLYLGDCLYDFTLEFLEAIKRTGGRYLFMTNNSSKSVKAYIDKLNKMGIPADRDDFITSSQATAYYLHKHHQDQKLYVCGTESFKKELQEAGFTLADSLEEVQCVVMGFDTELTFQKLHDVSYLLLTQPNLPYIASNPDLVCPTEFGSVPDCGSVCQMIFNATGRRPVVIGKPSSLMPELAMERLGVSKEETCVIGDRIYTDILCGLNAGITGILVLSGETTQTILDESTIKPHLVIRDVSQITQALT